MAASAVQPSAAYRISTTSRDFNLSRVWSAAPHPDRVLSVTLSRPQRRWAPNRDANASCSGSWLIVPHTDGNPEGAERARRSSDERARERTAQDNGRPKFLSGCAEAL